jgi:hypothetical protein
MAFWVPGASAKDPWFKSTAYAPLERDAPFGSDEWGKPRGGLSMLQLIRYTDTPAGAYDELVIVPGGFEYPAHGKNGTVVTKVGNRISRIYVSQRNTCWNGRKSES